MQKKTYSKRRSFYFFIILSYPNLDQTFVIYMTLIMSNWNQIYWSLLWVILENQFRAIQLGFIAESDVFSGRNG